MTNQRLERQLDRHLAWVREERRRIEREEAANKDSYESLRALPVLTLPKQLATKRGADTKTYQANSNRHYLDHVAYAGIPLRSGTRYFKKRQLDVAIVCSEFMYAYYEDAWNLHYLNPENEEEVFARHLDLLLVVTSWKGLKGDDWRGIASPESKKRRKLLDMMGRAKQAGVPVVFQSTEDPSNFERFIDVAKAADFIFTSDEAMIPVYRETCGHRNIEAMSFGVNPLIHNPIGATRSMERRVLFAGSWMAKYPERVKDTTILFDGVLGSNHGLDIVDRNYHLDLPDYHFPAAYVQHVAPAIQYDALQQVSKCYDWVLNLNSIKYSPTMCARRIFESQALGNLIISNYSIAVNNLFPNVFTVHDQTEIGSILERTTPEDIERLRAEGIRQVMGGHTVYHRIDQLVRMVSGDSAKEKRRLLVVIEDEEMSEMVGEQTLRPDQVIAVSGLTPELYDSADIVAYMTNATYGEYYLEDLVSGFKYSEADVVRKAGPGEDSYRISVSTVKRDGAAVWRESVPYEDFLAGEFNGVVLTIDHLEWNETRSEADPAKKELSVIVPIYNNGAYLTYKCFASLKRMDGFESSEIILVDDGSTEAETLMAIRRLARREPNVRTFFFETGGSGSASRPRNKGLELATAPFVTYLDPDNEVLNDRYALLLREMKEDAQLDFAAGHMKKLAEKTSIIALPTVRAAKRVVLDDPKRFLLEHHFAVQSIQALVARREFLLEHKLEMVVGAVGQDSLFFQEMMLAAKRVLLINKVIHYYYAAVAGSTVNSVTPRFFERSVVREKARAEKFAKAGVLDAYKTQRFEHFFEHWYLVKLENSQKEDLEENVGLLRSIIGFYEPIKLSRPKVKRFRDYAESGNFRAIEKMVMEADKR